MLKHVGRLASSFEQVGSEAELFFLPLKVGGSRCGSRAARTAPRFNPGSVVLVLASDPRRVTPQQLRLCARAQKRAQPRTSRRCAVRAAFAPRPDHAPADRRSGAGRRMRRCAAATASSGLTPSTVPLTIVDSRYDASPASMISRSPSRTTTERWFGVWPGVGTAITSPAAEIPALLVKGP